MGIRNERTYTTREAKLRPLPAIYQTRGLVIGMPPDVNQRQRRKRTRQAPTRSRKA